MLCEQSKVIIQRRRLTKIRVFEAEVASTFDRGNRTVDIDDERLVILTFEKSNDLRIIGRDFLALKVEFGPCFSDAFTLPHVASTYGLISGFGASWGR